MILKHGVANDNTIVQVCFHDDFFRSFLLRAPWDSLSASSTLQVPAGHVWLQGDNWMDSTDSRHYGPVPLGLLMGRAFFLVFPLFLFFLFLQIIYAVSVNKIVPNWSTLLAFSFLTRSAPPPNIERVASIDFGNPKLMQAGAAFPLITMRSRDAAVPMGKQPEAWDVGHAAVFLASDEARFITGQVLVIDGGSSLFMPT